MKLYNKMSYLLMIFIEEKKFTYKYSLKILPRLHKGKIKAYLEIKWRIKHWIFLLVSK